MKMPFESDINSGTREVPGRKRRSSLLWLERIALYSGLVLLLTFAGFKFGQSESSDAGLVSFYQQVQAAGMDVAVEGQASEPVNLDGRDPEFSLWSDIRIKEYKESLQQETDPPLGVLRIERLNIEVPIYNGTDDFALNRGVGRIKGTARIDGEGNLGIAGHRDGFFRPLKDIQAGDVLELQTIRGAVRYRVGSTVIVDPSDVSVLAPTPGRTLTLVTCYPFYFVGHAPKRFIVQATAEPHIAMN